MKWWTALRTVWLARRAARIVEMFPSDVEQIKLIYIDVRDAWHVDVLRANGRRQTGFHRELVMALGAAALPPENET